MSGDGYVTPLTIRATGYALIAVTTIVAGMRFAIIFSRPRKFSWDDGFLIAAYVFFLTVSILYVVATPAMFRLVALEEGRIKPYASVPQDGLFIQKVFFVTTSGLWLTLWSVKFSLLALYKRLMAGLPYYIKVWWAVVGFCFVVLVGAVTSSMLSCSSLHAWFTAGACNTPRDVKAAEISLWYSFAVDVLTDLMIMILPIRLIWRLQMALKQKIGVGALFCLGWICIVVAIIRVKQLGSTVHHSTPKVTWLALWGIIECSIAVIIGCGPGLYSQAKQVHHSRSAKSRSYVAYADGSRRGAANSGLHSGGGGAINLAFYDSKGRGTTTVVRGAGSKFWSDGHSSQEELATPIAHADNITVTRSVTVGVHENGRYYGDVE